jgi:hypothetical protein
VRLSLAFLALAACGGPDEPAQGPPLPFNKVPPTLPRLFRQRTLTQWLDLADSPDPARRAEAPWALAELSSDAAVVGPVLERLLGDASPDVRYAAAVAVGRFPGDLGPRVAERVVALLGAPERGVANAARAALAELGPRALPALEACLRGDEVTALAALRALADLGAAAEEASPALVQALAREELRRSAALALERVGAAALPAMVKRLSEAGEDEALVLLGLIAARGREAAPHVAEITRAFRRPPPVRTVAGEALVAAGPAGKTALEALAKDPDADVATAASAALASAKEEGGG